MMSRVVLVILGCTIMMTALKSQHELSFYAMDSLWNKSHINPSQAATTGWTIALPGMYFGINHSGGAFDDLISVEGNTLVIDKDKWLEGLDESNGVISRYELNTLHLALQKNDFTWSFGHSFKNVIGIDYPIGLAQVVINGNAPYLDQTLELGPSVNVNSYSEFGLGLAWKRNGISIGARAKYLNGIQLVDTRSSGLSLYTSDDVYQLDVNTDYELISSSLISEIDVETLTFKGASQNLYQMFTANQGYAFDLGMQAELTSSIRVEASILDLGKITWTEDVKKISSKGNFKFEGFDLAELINADSTDLDEIVDSVKTLLEFVDEDLSEYKYELPSRIYFAIHYAPTKYWKLSGLYSNEKLFGKSNSAYGMGFQYNIFHWWSMGTTATYRFEDFNVGLNSKMKLGPVQLYFATDNILSAFRLAELANSNFRGGLNVAF